MTTKTATRAAAFALALLGAAPAHAAKPPLPEARLIEMSDLVVEARVAGVACGPRTSRTVGGATLSDQAVISTLQVLSTEKGQPPSPLLYRGLVVTTPAGFTGPIPPPPLGVGWHGKLYLVKVDDTQYETTYQGDTLKEASDSQPQSPPSCGSDEPDAGCSIGGRGRGGGLAGLALGALTLALRRRRSGRWSPGPTAAGRTPGRTRSASGSRPRP
jgi:hypothetical protein